MNTQKEKSDFDADELLIFYVRRHWFVLATEVVGILVVAVLPLIAFEVVTSVLDTHIPSQQLPLGVLFTALYSIWLIFMWMALFNIWTNYYLDTWMLTNKRFIATDHVGFFHRSVATFRLERMQDVIVTTQGILPTLLKFGSIQVQTAGEEGNFEIKGLPNPEKLKTMILESAGEASKKLYAGDT